MLRYAAGIAFRHLLPAHPFPWGTFTVNVAGCFLIGLFYAWADRFGLPDHMRLLLTAGLCGGFTTFSTFCYEGIGLLKGGSYCLFFLYVVLSLLLGWIAVAGGAALGK